MFTHKDATKNGIDIAKGRVDDLDKEVLRFALNYKGRKVAVDLGSGQSRLSIILALLGFEVWCIDKQNLQKCFATLEQGMGLEGRVHFLQKDLADLSPADLPDDIVIVVCQRTLHHLKYNDARSLLQKVYNKMIPGGKMFLSVSGLESKLAEGYECADSPVAKRFCEVGEVGKSTYSIEAPVCLYTQKEVVELLQGVGVSVNKEYKSAFGNIKAICTKEL